MFPGTLLAVPHLVITGTWGALLTESRLLGTYYRVITGPLAFGDREKSPARGDLRVRDNYGRKCRSFKGYVPVVSLSARLVGWNDFNENKRLIRDRPATSIAHSGSWLLLEGIPLYIGESKRPENRGEDD